MTTFVPTQDQLDAILTMQEKHNLTGEAALARLRAEKHPAFAGAQPQASPAPAQGLNLPPARTAVRSESQPAPAPAPQLPAAPAAERHEVARVESTAAVQIATDVEGAEFLTRTDIKIPQLKIGQGKGNNADLVPLGAWHTNVDPAGHSPKRVLRVLNVQPERTFKLPYGDANERAREELCDRIQRETGVVVQPTAMKACSSPDGIAPALGGLAATCASCRYAKWRTTPSGKRVKPDCSEGYLLAVLDETGGSPAWLRLYGRAVPETKNFLTTLVFAAKREKRALAGFRVEVGSKKVGEKGNESYAPAFGAVSKTTEAELEEGLAIRRGMIAFASAVEHDADDTEE